MPTHPVIQIPQLVILVPLPIQANWVRSANFLLSGWVRSAKLASCVCSAIALSLNCKRFPFRSDNNLAREKPLRLREFAV
jgi:hypothetical protein